jgi:hypothetical protein
VLAREHTSEPDGLLAVERQNASGTLVVREVRAPGAAIALRAMVCVARIDSIPSANERLMPAFLPAWHTHSRDL